MADGGRRARPASSQAALIGRLSGAHPAVNESPAAGRCATLRRDKSDPRRVVAKPVRFRHSPATVTALRGRKSGRRPHGACSNLREKGRQDRAIHRISPSFDTHEARGFAIPRDPRAPSIVRRLPPCPSPVPRSAPLLVLVALAAILFGACSGAAASPTSRPPRPARAPRSRPPVRPLRPPPAPTSAAAFPANVTDDEGTAVDPDAEPQKIVSLTPANTEILFALGAGDRVVATDDSERLSRRPEAQGAARRRDLRVRRCREDRRASAPTSSSPAGSASTRPTRSRSSASVGIPVLVLYAPSVDGVYKDIELIGDAVGQRRRGRRADRHDAAPRWTRSPRRPRPPRPPRATKPRVFYDVGYTDATGQIYGAGRGLVPRRDGRAARRRRHHERPGDLRDPARDAHREGPAGHPPGRQRRSTRPTPETVAKRTGWTVLTAVKNGDIRPVQDTEITRPGRACRPACGTSHWACTRTSRSPPRPRTEHAVSVTALSPDLGTLGLAERIRGRPGLIAVAGLVALALLLVAGVTLGSARIGPGDTIGVILWRTLGLDFGRTWTAGDRDDRVGPAGAAGADGDARRARDSPSPAPRSRACSATRWPIRTSSARRPVRPSGRPSRCSSRSGSWSSSSACSTGSRSPAPSRPPTSSSASAGPGRPGGLTRLLLTGYAVGSVLAALLTMAMYVSGDEPPPDLLVPARRPRRVVVDAPARRGAADPRRVPGR